MVEETDSTSTGVALESVTTRGFQSGLLRKEGQTTEGNAEVQTGVVVDRNQAVQGLLTLEAVAHKMREGDHATEFGDLALLGEPGEGDDLDPGAADRAALEGV